MTTVQLFSLQPLACPANELTACCIAVHTKYIPSFFSEVKEEMF